MPSERSRPATQLQPIEVAVWRGGIRESAHIIHAAAVLASGDLNVSFGESGLITTLRSAAKPLQAIPLFTKPQSEPLQLNDEELAICCASHPGHPRHCALAASVLALSGFLPDDLVCGIADLLQSPLKHGCSGNHAAILLIAKRMGAPLDGYHLPDHPTQQLIRATIGNMAGAGDVAVAIDGCGIPTFGLKLEEMARSFARLVDPDAHWSRLSVAITAHPDLIGSDDWIDVRLMEVTGGRILAKTGAEGLLCLGNRESGEGMAVKVLDGSTRALAPAVVPALRNLGWLTSEESVDRRLAELAQPEIRSTTRDLAAKLIAVVPE